VQKASIVQQRREKSAENNANGRELWVMLPNGNKLCWRLTTIGDGWRMLTKLNFQLVDRYIGVHYPNRLRRNVSMQKSGGITTYTRESDL
jgi:hypothetical protein